MRLNLIRSFGVVFIVIPLLLIAPTVCAASMDMTAETQSTGACQQGTAAPCFTTSSSSMSHCVLVRAMGEQVKPQRLISYDNICLSWCLENAATAEPSQVQASPFIREIIKIPPSTFPQYHCRNLLTSEEPPL